jgi:phospholipase C
VLRWLTTVVAALVFVVPGSGTALAAPLTGQPAATNAAPKARAAGPCRGAHVPKRYRHVVWIWFENHGIDQVIGSKQAPYFNAVAHACGLATRYAAISHPSLPNYIAATSGGMQGINDDASPKKNATHARSIFQLVRSWKAYQESMPKPCHLKNGNKYAVRHDPSAYYLALRPTLCRRDVPLGTPTSGALASDLRHNHLPKFSFITPNTCSDMHDCSVSTGDRWLRSWLPKLLGSRAYRAGRTAIFLTFDESEGGGGNRVMTIAISPSVRRGSRTAAALSHYSLLRATQQMLGLRPLLGNAAHAPNLRPRMHI